MESARLPNKEVTVVCKDCQSEFTAKSRGALRCAPCRVVVAKAAGMHPERRKPADRQFPCHGCGKPFTANRSDAKWCPNCLLAKTLAHNNRPRPEKARLPNMQRACKQCGVIYMASLRTIYCEECRRLRRNASSNRSQAKLDRSLCPKCGGQKRKNSKTCRSCNSRSNLPDKVRSGPDHPNWKGGRWLDGRGYWNVWTGPNTNEREHRALWVEANGPIPVGFDIHHINGDTQDNRLDNLECLSSAAHALAHHDVDQHRSLHLQERDAEIARLEARIRELEAD